MKTSRVLVWCLAASGLLLAAALPASAERWKWGEGSQTESESESQPRPNVIVITNVDVTVKTWLDLLPQTSEQPAKKQSGKAGKRGAKAKKSPAPEKASGLGQLFQVIGSLSKDRANIVVITNVQIDVATWLDLLAGARNAEQKPSKP